ncbi:hypothetical protein CLV62_12166 [Dysgonomonas alginatilytica]|uniref:Uncharacterized protein n=1 Tax=Dysgonomonas alginatilytica TaxID=1605892 RepID=A0A2V3PLS2_9BACT|nr:hypothetical protein [Dysgonomonas alginatilytica]PXV62243.1 hypothetical protein CLV62_12166 [Dysgonomonas alginatilytica]
MNEIDKIIEKYFDGETSLREEEILRNYFLKPDIEARHKMYVPMFAFFTEERKVAEPPQKAKKKFPLYLWAGIAASILLLVCIKFAYTPADNVSSKSMVYIDGKKISDMQTINNQALISIENVSNVDEEILNSQIDILDSFTE